MHVHRWESSNVLLLMAFSPKTTHYIPVMAVMTLQPCTPRACMACKSAWMPAPPPESDPAMVQTMGGVGSTADVASIAVVASTMSTAAAELIALPPALKVEGTVTKPDSSSTKLDKTSTTRPCQNNILPIAPFLPCASLTEFLSNFLKCNPGWPFRSESVELLLGELGIRIRETIPFKSYQIDSRDRHISKYSRRGSLSQRTQG